MPPPKRVKQTDAIFEQLKGVNPEADRAEDTLRVSIDAKATVNIVSPVQYFLQFPKLA